MKNKNQIIQELIVALQNGQKICLPNNDYVVLNKDGCFSYVGLFSKYASIFINHDIEKLSDRIMYITQLLYPINNLIIVK